MRSGDAALTAVALLGGAAAIVGAVHVIALAPELAAMITSGEMLVISIAAWGLGYTARRTLATGAVVALASLGAVSLHAIGVPQPLCWLALVGFLALVVVIAIRLMIASGRID